MMRLFTVLALGGILLLPVGADQGRGRGRGRGQEQGREEAALAFAPQQRTVITDYYRSKGGLPPGIEKKLARGGKLPPGLAKKFQPFPAELESRLPPCPPDVRRGIVGGAAVMYSSRTGLVIDVMALIGR